MNLHIARIEKNDQTSTVEMDQLTAKLWDIEIVTGSNGLRIESQLTMQSVLIVLLNGSGTLIRDSTTVRMRSDTIYIAPEESTFSFESGNCVECAVAVIRYSLFRESRKSRSKLYSEQADEIVIPMDGVTLAPAGRLGVLCQTMKEQHVNDDNLIRWRSQLTFQELLFEALATVRRRPKASSREALEHAKVYIDEHYSEDLTIERLSGIAELSPKYFVDLFKRHYGVSAFDHLTHVRMNKAKRLMLCSDMRLKDIAYAVGYKDEFYFSRKFRKSVGVAPTVFIKKRSNKLAVYGSASLLGYLVPLQVIPYVAPMHPKWAGYYHDLMGADIAVYLDAYRHNHYKFANLEKLREASPELILCLPGLDPQEKARLEEFADVFEFPEEAAGWRARLRAVAQRLDEQAEAERWIKTYERKVIQAQESLGSQQKRTVVLTVRLLKNQFYAYCNRGMSEVLVEGLDAAFPIADTMIPFDQPITLEELDAIETDWIFLLICQETETLEGWNALKQSPEWLSLQAVRSDKVRLISSDPWREYSPIALERMLEVGKSLLSGERP